MQDVKRKYVIPGDIVAEGNLRALVNVFRNGNSIVSTRIGITETNSEGAKVIPLSGIYFPRANDIVIGKILDHSSLSWSVDINSSFAAHLPAQDIFGRDFSPAHDDMGRQLSTGDVIVARIAIFDRTRDPILTIQDKDMGKIPTGELLKISPTRVPRLIGKRGSMIQTIEQASSTRITIGQNGIIVVSGKDKEGVTLAINAIHIVEVEAHTSNLTQRIKQLLNVPESEIEGDDDSQTSNEANETLSSDEKSISNNINSEMGVVNPNGSK